MVSQFQAGNNDKSLYIFTSLWSLNLNSVILVDYDFGCPSVVNPVCGNDGKTYFNKCALKKQNFILGGKSLKIAHHGVCSGEWLV